jgi:hypothetical protein
MMNQIKIQGFDSDGEWFALDLELWDLSIDVVVDDGRWAVNMEAVKGDERDLHVSWQGGRAADRALVRPVSQNHVVVTVDRSRRRSAMPPTTSSAGR